MRIGILQFPGSNCERETILAVQRAGMQATPCLWNESHDKIKSCDGYIIVGGFSYEDRCRAGLIASLDPVMQIIEEENKLCKPILGICNGTQILIERGIIPGLTNNKIAIALNTNKRIKDGRILGTGFYNNWIYLETTKIFPNNAFTRYFTPNKPIHIPTAHAEGRFILAKGLFEQLEKHNVAMLQYCNEEGGISAEFPINPNGSENNLAAISNPQGNVMAIMPHPERTTNGDLIFNSMRDYIKEKNHLIVPPLSFDIEPYKITTYQKKTNTLELIVDSIITDNTAMSLKQALKNLNLNVNVRRQTHWEIKHHSDDHKQLSSSLIKSNELFNPNKERLTSHDDLPKTNTISFLVRDKENLIGQKKHKILTNHFQLEAIDKITQGTLWHITVEKNHDIQEISDIIINKHILFNPYAHECYIYR